MSADPHASTEMVRVDGKFFRAGTKKFHVKGVSYGPFAPVHHPEGFASPDQTRRDFGQIQLLGANVVRTYHVPPAWFLDLAVEYQLRVFLDIPWPKHLCFLASAELQAEARRRVREAALACRDHPGVFALSVVNEVPADIARWSGAQKVAAFIDELVEIAKEADPDRLVTFTNFPSTEYLESRNCDFVCFNVYLHQRQALADYLRRLQTLADTKPLVLGEFGLDSRREGERQQGEFLAWQIELACRGGLAGTVAFSFTDDWYRGGQQIEDWGFGLTRRDRIPKPAFDAVQRTYAQAPCFPLPRTPRVSVVVASYNGARTLTTCLESLLHLNYPDYEVILVDDGSTDETPEIAARFPTVRTIRQPNRGLSAARNTGIAAATGEIVAFTDSDCRADEDWLHYLIGDLLDFSVAGIGGHNLLPPEDSCVAAAVMASPGGPAHVMLSDREAEHVPGCNMAFFKRALEEIGGFDPVYRKAGDDVDICWRLQQAGHKIGFSPAGFVWHYRRSTVQAYLKQQSGYGEAEALLARKHPNYFNALGGSLWRGRIYSCAQSGVVLQRPLIHHGVFGSGFFQSIYAPPPSLPLMLCTSLEYYLLAALPMWALAWVVPVLWPVPVAAVLLPLGVCSVAAAQAPIPRKQRRFWSRPLVALLFLLQPLERGLARYRSRLSAPAGPSSVTPTAQQARDASVIKGGSGHLAFWSASTMDRFRFLSAVIAHLNGQGWQTKEDTGWADYDVEILGDRWAKVRLITACEFLDRGATVIRTRLDTSWTFEAIVIFWVTAAVEVLGVGLFAEDQPWIWMVLLSLPLLSLIVEYLQSRCVQNVAASIQEVAASLEMVSLSDADGRQQARLPAPVPG